MQFSHRIDNVGHLLGDSLEVGRHVEDDPGVRSGSRCRGEDHGTPLGASVGNAKQPMVPYLVSVEYANADREFIVSACVARQYTDDVVNFLEFSGPLGKLQHVLLSGVGLLVVLRTRIETSHRVAGRISMKAPLVIQSIVVEVV